MAGTVTLSASSPFATLSTTEPLFHSSLRSHPSSAKLSFPHHSNFLNRKLGICHPSKVCFSLWLTHSFLSYRQQTGFFTLKSLFIVAKFTLFQPSNSISEEPQESIDGAFFFDGDGLVEDDETGDEEDDAESSIDLLLRFLQSLFKKISRRAKKATRSVLPTAISTQLVICCPCGLVVERECGY